MSDNALRSVAAIVGDFAMANTEWELIGTEYGNCNCDYGCPCQFNGRPSSEHGDCRYATFTQIDEGYYGDVKLDGLRFAWLGGWPGAVHEGDSKSGRDVGLRSAGRAAKLGGGSFLFVRPERRSWRFQTRRGATAAIDALRVISYRSGF